MLPQTTYQYRLGTSITVKCDGFFYTKKDAAHNAQRSSQTSNKNLLYRIFFTFIWAYFIIIH